MIKLIGIGYLIITLIVFLVKFTIWIIKGEVYTFDLREQFLLSLFWPDIIWNIIKGIL